MYRLFFALFVSQFILFPAIADEPCQLDGDCVVVGEWDISVAVGYGNKTNPIANYDDIPLYAIPSIAYYGESWFFDNFNFGYTLTEQETFTINLATSYSDERAFFIAGILLISFFLNLLILTRFLLYLILEGLEYRVLSNPLF
ncbi:MipA/OmpV family protein [Shewanella sp. ENK2]|uniref:MipA/OmpV family protein n=1 Tax=Shewanella sp. ENK2 TaxID=2775245 RepID=UPI0037492756